MAVMFVLVMDRTYEVHLEMGVGGMMYIRSLIKTATGVQAILKFCLRNVNDCNVGITDGKDL
jgi:hypothetical protein